MTDLDSVTKPTSSGSCFLSAVPGRLRQWISGDSQSLLTALVLTLGASAWLLILGLITVPILVRGMGPSTYGIYTVAFSVVALGSYLDFGLASGTTKFVAEAHAQGAARRVGGIVAISVLMQGLIALFFSVLVADFAPSIASRILHLPAADLVDGAFVLRIAAFSFCASTVNAVFVSALRGQRRYAAVTMISVVSTTLSLVGAALAVQQGMGIRVAALAQLGGALVGLVAGFAACWPSLRIAEGEPKTLWQLGRAMLGFSLWTYVNRLSQMMVFHVDKILLARLGGTAMLAFYAVPFSLSQRINFVAGPAVTAIYPVAAAAGPERTQFVEQYLRVSRLVHVLTAAPALVFLVLGHRLMTAWVGQEMADGGRFFFTTLTIGFWVNSAWSLDCGCIEACNRPRTTSVIFVTALTAGILVGLLVAPALGAAKGIAVAVATYLCIIGIAVAVTWRAMARYSLRFALRRIALPIAEMAVLALLLAPLCHRVFESHVAVIGSTLVLIVFLAAYGAWRAFSSAELAALWRRVVVGRALEAPSGPA